MGDPERGGVNPTSKSWKRTIYLITDARHAMNKDSIDAIADRIKEDNVSLRVIGVDFDDEAYDFREQDKDSLKAENEEWWHNWLQQLPDSRIATAACALEQATLPNISLQGSAPYATSLTFGDPDDRYTTGDALGIPVKMYKLTTRVLPMSRKTMSKLAEQTEGARREKEATQQAMSQMISQDGAPMPTPTPVLPMVDADEAALRNTYMVDQRRLFFLAEEAKEIGTDNATPLEEGAEEHFRHAYKLGASLIPITPDLDVEWQSTQGLEIIQWIKQSSFKRHYLLGNIWNIFADSNNLEAQISLSSLAKAMKAQEKLALVRFVRRTNAEPKLGVLYPVTRIADQSQAEYFNFAEVPFSEDLKRFTFPSLERVVTADGKELKEHRSLPNDAMFHAMEGLVDTMDLSHAFQDEDGSDLPWFSTEDSFNPAIHRMKDAVAWRVMHPDSTELPRPHWEVDKFLDTPQEVREASAPYIEHCKKLFNIRYYPEKNILKAKEKRERDQKNKANVERFELDLSQAVQDNGNGTSEQHKGDSVKLKESATEADQSQSQKRLKSSTGQSQPVQGKLIDEDSDTEDEEDMLAPASSRRPASKTASQLQSQTQTQTQAQSAPQRKDAAPEDDSTPPPPPINFQPPDPVGSFRFYIEEATLDQGEVIRALQRLIVQLIKAGKDESSRLARDALCAGKTAASEYDEAEEWNAFIRMLKSRLVGGETSPTSTRIVVIDAVDQLNTSYKAFWTRYCKGNLSLGLVTRSEDEGGRSQVSDEQAAEVSCMPWDLTLSCETD